MAVTIGWAAAILGGGCLIFSQVMYALAFRDMKRRLKKLEETSHGHPLPGD